MTECNKRVPLIDLILRRTCVDERAARLAGLTTCSTTIGSADSTDL